MILNCRDLVERATDAREGGLTLAERITYALHLAWCRHCRLYLRQLERTIEALRSVKQEGSAPASVREEVLKRFPP